MPPQEENNRIEELKKSLYSRTAPDVHTRRKLRFSNQNSDIKTSWERKPEEEAEPVVLNEKGSMPEDDGAPKLPMKFFSKLLLGSVVFFIIAVGLGTLIFFKGGNLISANNIDISISGPVSIPGGEPVSFDIRVSNKNSVDLKVADLSVEFPDGTTNPKDPTQEMKTFRELLGDIPAGRSAEKTIQAIIFGEENLQKQIRVTVTYSVKGSTAIFTKTRDYDVLINSSPINVSVESFTEVTSGQETEFKVNIKSNSKEVLKNVLLKSEYPFGFTFTSSTPKPLAGTTVWKIGDIPVGGTRTVTIKGVVEGEDSDTRVFRFRVGAQNSSNAQDIGTEYMTVEQELAIQKPFISLTLSANRDDPDKVYVARFGEPVRVEASWFNNLPVAVSDVEITVRLSGSAYDKANIQPELGYYRSATDEIVWNRQGVPELASIGAGDSGEVSFTVIPTNKSTASQLVTNPSVSIHATVSGRRTQESRVPETLSSVSPKVIRVGSNVSLSGRIVRSTGPFTNTGPMPPKAEQTTTYTVYWTVDNTSNSVSNAQVTATLPQHVKWLGQVSPSSEALSYDPATATITWNAGSIGSHTSSSARRKEIIFQIGFEPGANLIDQAPILVNVASLTAVDDFTERPLESRQDYLTTRFTTDPAYREGDEKVSR